TGDRGGGLIPFLNEIPELRVVACSDLIPFRLEQALSKVQGRAKAYPDYRNLLADKDVDAVLVATPFGTHDKIAVDALEAGKHVFVEKTMAKGYAGIERLATAAKGSKKILQTGHQYHSSRLYSHIVEEIERGRSEEHTSELQSRENLVCLLLL